MHFAENMGSWQDAIGRSFIAHLATSTARFSGSKMSIDQVAPCKNKWGFVFPALARYQTCCCCSKPSVWVNTKLKYTVEIEPKLRTITSLGSIAVAEISQQGIWEKFVVYHGWPSQFVTLERWGVSEADTGTK